MGFIIKDCDKNRVQLLNCLSGTTAARISKWRSELKECEDIVNTRVWKGNTHFTLEKFVSLHRSAHERMVAAAEHTSYQLPDGRRRVERLLAAIQTSDPDLRAMMAQVRSQSAAGGAMEDFDRCVALLLPACPVVRLRKSGGRGGGGSDAQVSAVDLTAGKGPSGVEYRYYSKQEYGALTAPQKAELKAFREARKKAGLSSKLSSKKRPNGGNGGGGASAKKLKRHVKLAISEVVAELASADDAAASTKNEDKADDTKKANVSALLGTLRRNIENRNGGQKE